MFLFRDTKRFNNKQAFFLNCWKNMIHESSLEFNRVSVLNPASLTKELIDSLTEKHFSKKRINSLYEELCDSLDQDVVIGKIENIPNQIDYIKTVFSKLKKDDNYYQNKYLINLLDKLYSSIIERYDDISISYFINELKRENVNYNILKKQIHNFLSFLIHKNSQDIGSLFVYLYNILVRAKGENDLYNKFELLRRITTEKDRFRCVVFGVLNQEDIVNKFPYKECSKYGLLFFRDINDLNINLSSLRKNNNFDQDVLLTEKQIDEVANIIENKKDTIYCIYASNDIDGKVAGNNAFLKVEEIIDLLSLWFNKPFSIYPDFCFIKENNKEYRIVKHKIDDKVVGFSSNLNMEVLDEYLSNILNNSNGKYHKVIDALKFYRLGKYSDNLSEKTVHYWTCLEHLLISGKENIGDTISEKLSYVIANRYLLRHLAYIRSAFIDRNLSHLAYDNERLVDFISKGEYTKLSELSDDYSMSYLSELKNIISKKDIYQNKLKEQQKYIKNNLSRIYKSRCAIVHNSKPLFNLVLLCSDLESYLNLLFKTILESYKTGYVDDLSEFFLLEELFFDLVTKEQDPIDKSLLLDKLENNPYYFPNRN